MNCSGVIGLYSSRSVLLLLLLPLIFRNTFAQSGPEDPGNWLILNNQIRLHEKWSTHAEFQYRSYDLLPNTEQVLVRAGFNYHMNQQIIFSAGYGWITNYKNEDHLINSQIANENRIWEQALLKSNSGRLFFEHRYRLEQRWIQNSISSSYRNRIRYLFRTTIPINSRELKRNTLFFTVYDELFISLTNVPFDRNRLYAALGFQATSRLNVQAGWLVQTVGTVSKQYLQLGVNYLPDLRKPK